MSRCYLLILIKVPIFYELSLHFTCCQLKLSSLCPLWTISFQIIQIHTFFRIEHPNSQLPNQNACTLNGLSVCLILISTALSAARLLSGCGQFMSMSYTITIFYVCHYVKKTVEQCPNLTLHKSTSLLITLTA